jgi:hypothetical protein
MLWSSGILYHSLKLVLLAMLVEHGGTLKFFGDFKKGKSSRNWIK